MRLAVVGASGRMGRAVVRLAKGAGLEVVCAIGASDMGRDAGELAGIGPIGTSVTDSLGALEHARAAVVVDFSAPAVTAALAPIAAAAGSAIVSGTTGLTGEGRDALALAAKRVPVLWEPNVSLGVHVLSQLVAQAAAALGDWDIEIVEVHHHAKIDAPSGTALRLAEVAQRAREGATHLVHGREGKPGARRPDEIGMHAVRGGDVIGDHTVHLFGGAERIELTHRATSRDVFAHGAVRCATWIAGKPAGTYSLSDVLAAK
jgi:4-hydroxy-tetrahydrodipicolinate reductase